MALRIFRDLQQLQSRVQKQVRHTKPAKLWTDRFWAVIACFTVITVISQPRQCQFLQERQKLLSFVVVGGGPTGVEVAAELHDMIDEDLSRLYPDLIQDVRIRIIELQDHLLSTYDRAISTYTAKTFKRYAHELHRSHPAATFASSLLGRLWLDVQLCMLQNASIKCAVSMTCTASIPLGGVFLGIRCNLSRSLLRLQTGSISHLSREIAASACCLQPVCITGIRVRQTCQIWFSAGR